MDTHGGEARPGCQDTIRLFNLLGKRWTGLIVTALLHRPAYFAELRRAVDGISERMLSRRLGELAAAGLVVREVSDGHPVRVSYRLTEAGAALEHPLTLLGRWGHEYLTDSDAPSTTSASRILGSAMVASDASL